VAVVASIGLVVLLVQLAGVEAFWAQAKTVEWVWVGWAAALSALLPVLRGLRFVSTMPRVEVPLMVAVVGVQNFMARIMPFRTGELALPYLLEQRGAETTERALVLLIWLRLMDAWLLAGLFVIGLVLHVNGGDVALFWTALGGFVVFSCALFWMGAGVRLFFGGLAWAIGKTGLEHLDRMRALAERIVDAAGAVGALSMARRGVAVCWTAAVWIVQFAIFALVLWAFSIEVTALDVVVGVSLAQLAAALPLPSVGSVGTHEVGWVIGFGFVGVDRASAVVSGVAAQGFTLVFAAVVALVCAVYLRVSRPSLEGSR